MTPSSLLAEALRTDPARPLLTFTDDATGERTELSVATFANWVAKTANLLEDLGDELGLAPGALVALDLPVHWQAAVWLQACWSAGHPVRLGTADGTAGSGTAGDPALVVLAHDGSRGLDTRAPDAGAEVVSLGLGPMGLPRPGASPAYDRALDYDREVHGHGDRYVPVTTARPDDVALVTATGSWTGAELAARAAAFPAAGTVLVTAALRDARTAVATVLGPMAAGGRVVLCRHLDPERLPARLAEEAPVAAVTDATDGAQAQQTVTGVLREWNGVAPGMA